MFLLIIPTVSILLTTLSVDGVHVFGFSGLKNPPRSTEIEVRPQLVCELSHAMLRSSLSMLTISFSLMLHELQSMFSISLPLD